jgi:hypothetical protein
MENFQFFNTYRHTTATSPNIVFNNKNTTQKFRQNPIIKNKKEMSNDNDISGLDISKTLKYEKKKLEQHEHMLKLFKQKPSTYSNCSSCYKK